MRITKYFLLYTWLIISNLAFSQSQYFGQNKPRYKTFGFKVLQSPHFELYHYFKDNAIPNDIMLNSEHWYKIHQEVFKLAFIKPNPLIVYQNHPDFQETTAINGNIGEGTGGITEGFRNRVIMPMMYSKRQTDHVLGHELVHAFQYQLKTAGDSTQTGNFQNLPLFMVEGLAEYMSLGRIDAHTAMWMRDAVLNEDIPTIKDLITKEYKYFPYRWGQAFWAFITATYGDDIIRPLFRETAKYGVEVAFNRNLKLSLEKFSNKWKQSLIDTYTPFRATTSIQAIGSAIATQQNTGDMNISPSISPNGNFVAYISSKNIISYDIFIVETHTGKIIRKIESNSFGSHVDNYNFLETAGTWSPDNRKLAIVVQSKGRNKLTVIDIGTGNKESFDLKDLDAFTNPAWSPDGKTIVVSGMKQGESDLFLYDFQEKTVKNLTNDQNSDLQPAWSPDGEWIYFVSDRNKNFGRLEKTNYSISRINISTLSIENFTFLQGADNLNPQLNSNGKSIYFLSDADGFRNLYSYQIIENKVVKHTDFFTGISGITMYSPAISIASNNGQIVYNYFKNGKYELYLAKESNFQQKSIENTSEKTAAILAPLAWREGRNIVQANLEKQTVLVKIPEKKLLVLKYNPKFKLDYFGNSGIGVSASRWGTGLGGGVVGLFSDMLNHNQVSGVVSLNGQIQDFGGQVQYLNQKHPLQWGASLVRIPYRFTDYKQKTKYITDAKTKASFNLPYSDSLLQASSNSYRLFINQASVFAIYPLSIAKRIEVGGSSNWYSYSGRTYSDYYGSNTSQNYYVGADNPKKITSNSLQELGYVPFNLQQFYVALVGDKTTFGMTSPLNGYRYRFEASKYLGDVSHNSITADFRKYKYFKPFTLATRLYYFGRIGATNIQNYNKLYPMFLGYPWYMHGYWGRALTNQTSTLSLSEEQLNGSQMGLTNIEIRLPLTGSKKLSLINFPHVPSDLNFFFDMGMAWDDSRKSLGKEYQYNFSDGSKEMRKLKPIASTGISIRINALGYLILEPYLAFPIYNGKKQSAVTGINFMVPGW